MAIYLGAVRSDDRLKGSAHAALGLFLKQESWESNSVEQEKAADTATTDGSRRLDFQQFLGRTYEDALSLLVDLDRSGYQMMERLIQDRRRLAGCAAGQWCARLSGIRSFRTSCCSWASSFHHHLPLLSIFLPTAWPSAEEWAANQWARSRPFRRLSKYSYMVDATKLTIRTAVAGSPIQNHKPRSGWLCRQERWRKSAECSLCRPSRLKRWSSSSAKKGLNWTQAIFWLQVSACSWPCRRIGRSAVDARARSHQKARRSRGWFAGCWKAALVVITVDQGASSHVNLAAPGSLYPRGCWSHQSYSPGLKSISISNASSSIYCHLKKIENLILPRLGLVSSISLWSLNCIHWRKPK